MSRPRRYIQQNQEDITLNLPIGGRSPLRRTPCKQPAQHKSPYRSRTPTRPLSPLRQQHTLPSNICYIANVSPLRDRPPEAENHSDLSNGKSIKYIQGSKVDKNHETCRWGEFNKPSDRNLPQDNRLFGKMVDKLNSEKKGHPGGQTSHKTSYFADTQAKPKVDPSLRPSGTFKQLVSLAKAGETRSDIKPPSRGRDEQLPSEIEEENLSCLVYRVRNPKEQPLLERQSQPGLINNHCSPAVRRKPSQPQAIQRESYDDYRDLDLLLDKLDAAKIKPPVCENDEYFVRDSLLGVRESLSMDPYM